MPPEKRAVLVKYSAPTKLCSFPYGQIWKSMHDDEKFSLYIQTNKNIDEPHWMRMSDFLEKAFEDQLSDDEFIKKCLKMFANHIDIIEI